MKQKCFVAFISITLMILGGCSSSIGKNDEIAWIPSDMVVFEPEEESSIDEDYSYVVYEYADITEAFIDKDSTEGAHMIWANQCAAGSAKISENKLSENMLTFYISESEGDDSNTGRAPNKPKKTLTGFTDLTGINVLLKCGDTFSVDREINIDTNVNFGCYGQGRRPVLDYRKSFTAEWESVSEFPNLWKADFSGIEDLYVNDGAETNGNIGQLWIDGVCSFQRIYNQEDDPDLLAKLSSYGDGYFTVDRDRSVVYLVYSGDPNRANILYGFPGNAINITGTNVTLQGVEIVGAAFHGISMQNAENVKIACCYIHHVGGGLLRGHNVRFGNAIQLWDDGDNILVEGNVTDWIYDTALTNQTTTYGAAQNNLTFKNNICRFSFWGIESWGDSMTSEGFSNIVYVNNALMYICDPTVPDAIVYADSNSQLLNKDGARYTDKLPFQTCRGGDWPFNQMAAINASVANANSSLELSSNICWDTKRCMTLLILGTEEEMYPVLKDNTFYAVIPNENVCLHRYTDHMGTRHYVKDIGIGGGLNAVSVGMVDAEKYEMAYEALLKIVEEAVNQ